MQAAAEEVAREHPEGIDFLIVNAGVVDCKHKSAIETCAVYRVVLSTLSKQEGLTRRSYKNH